jgi:hypothetical protein
MPVKNVQLVHGEVIDVPLHKGDIEEVPRHIQVHPAPSKPRVVHDPNTGDFSSISCHSAPQTVRLGRDQLSESLDAVKQPRGLASTDDHPARRDLQFITLLTEGTIRSSGRQ